MLKAIGWLIRAAFFSIFILILGNWVRVGDRTVSDRVRAGMDRASKTEMAATVKAAAGKIAEDARSAIEDARSKPPAPKARKSKERAAINVEVNRDLEKEKEKIPPSEREKLKELIQELNRPQRSAANISPAHRQPVQTPNSN